MVGKAITASIAGLRVEESGAKIAAIQALAHFGRAAAPAVPALVRLMNDARARKDDWLTIWSAETLAQVGSHPWPPSPSPHSASSRNTETKNIRSLATIGLKALEASE